MAFWKRRIVVTHKAPDIASDKALDVASDVAADSARNP